MKIVLLPQWVKQTLEFGSVPVTAALDLVKLSSILSLDDVAFYKHLQNRASDLLPDAVYQSLAVCGLSAPGLESQPEYQQLLATHSMSVSESQHEMWLGPLADTTKLLGLTCDFLTDDVIAITAYTLPEGESAEVGLVSFYERLIGQLSMVHSFEAVAKMQLFHGYLKLL